MTTAFKYLLFGDGESPHMVKWVKALNPYFELYLISSRGIHQEIRHCLASTHCFPLNLSLKPDGGNLSLFKKLPLIARIIHKIRPQIVNAHYITSHGFVAALIRKFTFQKFFLVQSVWGSDLLVTPWKNPLYRLITSFSLQHSDLITTDARAVNEKVKLLSSRPVMTFVFGVMSLPKVDMNGKTKWLFFSNRSLISNYRIDRVIEHFSEVAEMVPEARLVIANDGYQRNELENKVKELGLATRIQFVGYLDELQQSEIYHQSSFYYSLPESDAASVSLLEAMSWGCIPVVSDLPANREWIRHNVNGFIEGMGNLRDLINLAVKRDEISESNQALIREKAYFPELIRKFAARINELY